MTTPLTASMLYAISQRHDPHADGGPLLWRCHWCGAPCGDQWQCEDIHWSHLDVGQKRPVYAACPGEPWICLGCWMFRRRRMTIPHLDGTWTDRKGPKDFSLWITEAGAWGILPEHGSLLYPLLLNPPLRFSLALLEGDKVNHPQLMTVNDHVEGVKSTTPLTFTLNGTKMEWTAYELGQALEAGNTTGTEPGVTALVRLLGWPPEVKRGKGRPRKEETNEQKVKRVVAPASGVGEVQRSASPA